MTRPGALSPILLLLAPALGGQETDTAARIELVVERLEQLAREHHVAGMGLAVVTPEGAFTRGIGVAELTDARAVTPETIFEIGSVTKTFTGVLVARLTEEGMLDYDDQVREHVPYFHLKDPEADAEVTLRDLLSHRTGVTRTDTMLNGMHQLTPEDIARQLGMAEPMAPFRWQFLYNNQMFTVVGLATEHAGEASYAELLDRHVFEPLAMDSSTAVLSTALADERMSTGYRWLEAEQEHQVVPTRGIAVCAPAGAILSSPEDMARYLAFLLARGARTDGEPLLPREAFDLDLWEVQIPTGPESGYGLGFNLARWRGRTMIHHDGALDGFTSTLALLPEEGIGFSLLTNAELSAVPQRSVDVVFATLLGEELQAVATAEADVPYTTEELEAFAGGYDFWAAGLIWTVAVDAAGRLTIDYPDVAVYTLAWPDEDGRWAISPEAHVVFDVEETGTVTALTLYHGSTTMRMPRKATPDLPSVDDVLALTEKALPMAAVEAARPLRIVGSVELVHEGLSGRFEVLYQDDDHWRLERDFGKFGRIATVVDGDGGWAFTSMRGRETLSAAELAGARRETPFSTLSRTRELYRSMRVLGVTGDGDDERIRLRATPLEGPAVTLHVDVDGSVRRADASFPIGELATIPIETVYADVREVHGMLLAHKVEIHNPLTGETVVVVENIERNVEIPASAWEDW